MRSHAAPYHNASTSVRYFKRFLPGSTQSLKPSPLKIVRQLFALTILLQHFTDMYCILFIRMVLHSFLFLDNCSFLPSDNAIEECK